MGKILAHAQVQDVNDCVHSFLEAIWIKLGWDLKTVNMHRVQKISNRPMWESNLSRRIYRQTLYHVAVKVGFYHKAVEVFYLPISTSYNSLKCAKDESCWK